MNKLERVKYIIENLHRDITNTALAIEILSLDGNDWDHKQIENLRKYIGKVKKKHLEGKITLPDNGSFNVLVVGDPHEPFALDSYLDHCIKVSKDYDCKKIIFIGDIIDGHYTSYHNTDPEMMGGAAELAYSKMRLQRWYKAFPKATVLIGNHDCHALRKMRDGNIPDEWVKPMNKVLGVPNWEFLNEYTYNGIYYTHGTGTRGQNAAYNRALHRQESTVIGHIHSEASIRYVNQNVFGMIVGCGINNELRAFAYNKVHPKKPIISCGVVMSDGTPILLNLK